MYLNKERKIIDVSYEMEEEMLIKETVKHVN